MLWRWFFSVASRLSLPRLHSLGRGIGRLLLWLPSKPRRIAAANIAACLPQLDRQQQRTLLADSLQHFGCAMAESPALWAAPDAQINQWLIHVRGAETVTQALNNGQGALILTPHIGSWEMLGLDASRRWPITHLYKAQKGVVDELIFAGRSRYGAKLAGSDSSGVRKLLAALKHSEAIGILPDQDPPEGSGLFVPFFGHLAHTPVLPAKLAGRPGVAVFLCWAERRLDSQGFEIHYEPAPAELADKDPQQALLALNLAVEKLILRLPQQYWWAYPRFRRRPQGQPPFYAAR